MSLPVVALVGRRNVGKSTLFNRLTKSRAALASNHPGLTRDRLYQPAKFAADIEVMMVDTGGFSNSETTLEKNINRQTERAIDESNLIFFMVSAKDGACALDFKIAEKLRQNGRPVILVVNKIDKADGGRAAEFYELGIGEPFPISAEHGIGIENLIKKSCDFLPRKIAENNENQTIKILITGHPNVGKSTLINRILGEKRVITAEAMGTTRDVVCVDFEKNGRRYILMDTAGIRRKSRVVEKIEKFTVAKTRKAAGGADVALFVVDAQAGISDQDATLLGMLAEKGRSAVIAVNKCDGLTPKEKTEIKRQLDRKLGFLASAPVHFISALEGSGVGGLFPLIEKAHQSATQTFTTAKLNEILKNAQAKHPPPQHKNKRPKLKYISQIATRPPTFIIFGNQIAKMPQHYTRFLENFFIRHLQLFATPVRFEFRRADNPFAERKNPRNVRQIQKKRRLMRFVKNKNEG